MRAYFSSNSIIHALSSISKKSAYSKIVLYNVIRHFIKLIYFFMQIKRSLSIRESDIFSRRLFYTKTSYVSFLESYIKCLFHLHGSCARSITLCLGCSLTLTMTFYMFFKRSGTYTQFCHSLPVFNYNYCKFFKDIDSFLFPSDSNFMIHFFLCNDIFPWIIFFFCVFQSVISCDNP